MATEIKASQNHFLVMQSVYFNFGMFLYHSITFHLYTIKRIQQRAGGSCFPRTTTYAGKYKRNSKESSVAECDTAFT